MLPGIAGMLGGLTGIPAGTIIVNDAHQVDNALNDNSRTFSIDGSIAQADRRIFIPIQWTTGVTHRTISSVTINGVSATVRQASHHGGASGLGAAIASAVVPTDNDAMDVVVNFTGGVFDVTIDSIITYGLASSVSDFATDENQGTATDLTGTVDVPANGFILASYAGSRNAAGAAVAWLNIDTEIYDVNSGGAEAGRASAAVTTSETEQLGLTITADITNQADAGNDLVVEVWGY